jgi:HlyD family secretion protein
MSQRRKRAQAAAALAVLLAGGAWLALRATAASSSSDSVAVVRSDLVLSVPVEGTLRAVDAYQLGPPAVRGLWNFKISRMSPEGADVKAGTPVLTFDASELDKRLLELRAELDSSEKEIEKKKLSETARRQADALRLSEARAKLEKAALKLERPKELVAARETKALELERDLAEREVAYLETRRRSLDEADATELENLVEQRDRARARVEELEADIARMTLRAPRDGTVVYVSNRGGEKKRVGDSVWRHDKVLSVPDLSRMKAAGFVDEADAGKLASGQEVELRLDAYPELLFRGRVTTLGKTIQAPSRNSPLRGLEVEIALDETDATRMRPEMRFRGEIVVARVERALLVPLSAVDHLDGRSVVYRTGPLGAAPVPVSLGRSDGTMVEVSEGLSEGDRILSRGAQGAPRS